MNRKFLFLILVIVLIGGAVFVFILRQTERDTVSVITSQVIPADIPKNSDIHAEDWKTYRNEKYGFEMRYPEVWDIDHERSSPDTLVFDTGIDGSRESVTFVENTNKISSSEWFESNRKEHKGVILKESRLTIDGVDSIKLETGEFAQSFIVFSNEKNLFLITTMGLIEEKKILETFRFL